MIWELKALACLLIYPDEEVKDTIPDVDRILQTSDRFDLETKELLSDFCRWFMETPLTPLQKDYVATFDIGKSASLNLFEHTQGDSKDRGSVMVELNQLYEEHGLEYTSSELPDYLPAFLEFLSGLKPEDADLWLESTLAPLTTIDRELQLDESPWAAVTAAIINFIGAERPEAAERTTDEMIPTLDAEYYEAPVTFGGAPNPVP